MSRLEVYRDTIRVDGRVYQCSGVRGKTSHRCEVYDGQRRGWWIVKPSRRWPFGPVLRNHTIELFRKRTDAAINDNARLAAQGVATERPLPLGGKG